jgi:hypothetical protein
MSSPCTMLQWSERMFLALSNLFFIIPIVSLLYPSPKRIRRLQIPIIEIIIISILALSSLFYHLCDPDPNCSGFCILSYNTLFFLDFVFSFCVMPVALLYTLEEQHSAFKTLSYTVFIITAATILYAYPDSRNQLFYLFGAIESVIVIGIRLLMLSYELTSIWREYCQIQCRLMETILACIFWILAFIFRSDVFSVAYWIHHSIWHICAAFGLFFVIELADQHFNTSSCNKYNQQNKYMEVYTKSKGKIQHL